MNFNYFYLNIFDVSKIVDNIYRGTILYIYIFFFFFIIEIYVYKFSRKNVIMSNVTGLNIHKNKHILTKNVIFII